MGVGGRGGVQGGREEEEQVICVGGRGGVQRGSGGGTGDLVGCRGGVGGRGGVEVEVEEGGGVDLGELEVEVGVEEGG